MAGSVGRRAGAACFALAGFGGIAWLATSLNRSAGETSLSSAAPAASARELARHDAGGRPPIVLDATAPRAGAAVSAGPVASAPRYTEPVRDRARADAVRRLLIALYAGRLATEVGVDAATPAPGMPAPDGEGNQAQKPLGRYVGRIMREQFVPLASGCYEDLLSRHPAAKGKLTLRFSIMGDESVGGVVVDASLGKGAELGDHAFVVCVEQSLYSVVFDPPPPGHPTITVDQSLELAP